MGKMVVTEKVNIIERSPAEVVQEFETGYRPGRGGVVLASSLGEIRQASLTGYFVALGSYDVEYTWGGLDEAAPTPVVVEEPVDSFWTRVRKALGL